MHKNKIAQHKTTVIPHLYLLLLVKIDESYEESHKIVYMEMTSTDTWISDGPKDTEL